MNRGRFRHRSKLAIFLVAVFCVFGAAQPSHAFLGFLKYIFFAPKKESKETKRQGVLVGQKVHVFDLHQANANDLQTPLQSYMDGVHSDGSLVVDPTKNALIVTDTPENLARIERLISSMDISYSNPSAEARQILVMQQMMKAIHTLGPMAGGSSSSSRELANAGSPVGVPAPSGIYHPEADADENVSRPQWKIIEERPTLSGFRVLGWVRDRHDTIVVLRSAEGQRYIYREGRLTPGRSFSNLNFVQGVSGSVNGNVLTLVDRSQGKVSLNMIPPIDRLGAHP